MTRASGKTDIPEMNEFLQKTHPQLKVVDVEGKGNKRKFILVCDVCSKDEELWPYGSIRQTKVSLLKTKGFCACSSSQVTWSEKQYKIRVERECNNRGYTFHGWAEPFKRNTTKLDLSNPVTGNRWQSTHINNLFVGKGDPWESGFLPDEEQVRKFKELEVYHEDTIFERDVGKKDTRGKEVYWKITCGECKESYSRSAGGIRISCRGCSCAKSGGGFDRGISGYLYINKFIDRLTREPQVLKYGITNVNYKGRCTKQATAARMDGETIRVFKHKDGDFIAKTEYQILQKLKTCDWAENPDKSFFPEGHTEALIYSKEAEKNLIALATELFNR